MREVTHQLFTINELSEEAKKKAIETYKTKNQEWLFDQCDADMLSEWMGEQLELKGYRDMKVYFSLSYCQGDGMRFEGDLSEGDILYIGKRLLSEEDYKTLLDMTAKGYGVYGKIEGTTHHYYHYNTMRVTIDSDVFEDYGLVEEYEDLHKAYTSVLEELEELIDQDTKEVSMELEKAGYEQIDYHYTDEYILDTLEANEIEFLEDGTLW